MIRTGLVGFPVAHSRSPMLHQAAFQAAGLEGHYGLYEAAPSALRPTLVRCRTEGLLGLNVTVPHKIAAYAFADTVDPVAQRAGAINTLIFRGGAVTGFNTDVGGFLDSLACAGRSPAGKRVLILGAGGAARAVLTALAAGGAGAVTVAARDTEAGRRLGESFGAECVDFTAPVEADWVVNTTTLGLGLHAGTLEWDRALTAFKRRSLQRAELTYDLVYAPSPSMDTPFCAASRQAGVDTIGGLDMLVRQAAIAFELWTDVPRSQVAGAMRDAAGLGACPEP